MILNSANADHLEVTDQTKARVALFFDRPGALERPTQSMVRRSRQETPGGTPPTSLFARRKFGRVFRIACRRETDRRSGWVRY
jgi:hypothetical protein